MSEKLVFVLGDKLPTYYNAAISIFQVASKPRSKKMINSVHIYACSLIDIWQRSFGNDHVMTRNAVTYKINKFLTTTTTMSMLIHIRKQARIKTKKTKEQRNQVAR